MFNNFSVTDKISFGLFIITVIMVIVTGFYTMFTYKMASITKKTYMLESRPYIAFDNIVLSHIGSIENIIGIMLELQFRNVGKVLVNYKVINIKISVGSVDYKFNPTDFENTGGYIFPGMGTTFKLPKTEGFNVSWKNLVGILEYEIEYYSVSNDKKYKSYRKLKFFPISVDPPRYSYVYMDEREEEE